MFNLFARKNKVLEESISSIEMNLSNNYKDAAQEGLKQFEKDFEDLKSKGLLKGASLSLYEEKLRGFQERMKNFTHKDQKPNW